MLPHSPPLPFVIDYQDDGIIVEVREGAILALKQYDRVRHVCLLMPVTSLQKLIVAMGDEYPILEYLIIRHQERDTSSILIFPETLQSTTSVPPCAIWLYPSNRIPITHDCCGFRPSTYFYPNTLLQWLSSMPQLETLIFVFVTPVPNCDVERQLTHTLIMTSITLPSLHRSRSKVLELTWVQFFIRTPPLASKSFKSTS